MRKERNDAGTSTKSAEAAAKEEAKVLVTQQESISDEESDTITDQSSSMSEHKKHHGATQFSVQRSDTDCLRMRISAIRPTVSAKVETKHKSSIHNSPTTEKVTEKNTTATITKNLGDKVNNNTLDSLKIKLNQHHKKPSSTSINNMLVRTGRERSVPIDSKTLTMSLAQSAACLSDATESGCSEATTTTIAAATEKSTKKVKVKRKKAPPKSNDAKHKSSKKSLPPSVTPNTFSSDSDDEPLQKLQQQRAPRLLITAINSKNTQLKPLNSLAPNPDNIALSSSDNELPDLVSAAIKRVESDTEDTGGEFSTRLSAKTKQLPQYQSTLLQDFMEKTQMLGQTPAVTPARLPSPEPATNTTPNHVSDNQSSVAHTSLKKRRGRPKKIITPLVPAAASGTESTVATAAAAVAATTSINESADSGVISTASTAQSSSPSPRLSAVANKSENCVSPTKSLAELGSATSSSKPKIDFVNLDKRMYATERVLYPPPRNKRRQSSSTGPSMPLQPEKKLASSETPTSSAAAKLAKEELQLDPVWRKIDVNKKFRRPSVSGYKSDGGGGNTTICSKILAAQSGYVSDYGSAHPRTHHHNHGSGYKSDASCKSRYSTRSCVSTRRNRAKSCGYRSDCKESEKLALKCNKFRRKRRASTLIRHHSKLKGNLNDEQDILQLAGLTLGQSSEESNEYVCKPSLKCLPTTSVSKKYGEINRFVATGEYFGRGAAGSNAKQRIFLDTAAQEDIGSQDGFRSFSGKLNLLRKNSLGSELAADMLSHASRKIKSRRSSAASYCSSFYSGVSKVRRRRRRKSFRFPAASKSSTIDSKLLTEIDIITNTFATLCRIQHGDKALASVSTALKEKDKLFSECSSSKFQTLASIGTKRDARDKRSLKKRKLSENLDFALLCASAGGSGGSLTPSSSSSKRRHKKANSSSPDDHKLPLKKRHYLLTPGEKTTEAAAVAAKLFANNAEALAAAAAAAKSSASSLAISSVTQQKVSSIKSSSKNAVTPKKRHLLQTAMLAEEAAFSLKSGSNHSSPLRISVETATNFTGSKLLDISPALSTGSTSKLNIDAHKKRTRLEGLVTKIASHSDATPKISVQVPPQVDSENSSCPPPGVFEPTVELEIQIPPLAKLTEAAAIITKSEVDSPLLLELNRTFPLPSTKVESGRVVEDLLNKTGGNLLLKRKRKKINRTGFPTVRRKKRKINENMLLDVTPDIAELVEQAVEQARSTPTALAIASKTTKTAATPTCDRVPQTGEDSDSFLERANRAPPRLSVVSLERLQGTNTKKEAASAKKQQKKQEKLQIDKLDESAKTAKPSPADAAKKAKLAKTSKKAKHTEVKGAEELKKAKTAEATKIDKQVEATKIDKQSEEKKDTTTTAKPSETPSPNKQTKAQTKIIIHTEPQKNVKPEKNCKATAVKKDDIGTDVKPSNRKARKSAKDTDRESAKDTDKKLLVPVVPNKKLTTPAAKLESLALPKQTRKMQAIIKSTKNVEKMPAPCSTSNGVMSQKELKSKRLLPAGIDPKINFSCKIRLKRRSSLHCITVATAKESNDYAAEALSKDPHSEQLEQDVLPLNDIAGGAESEAASDTSDEKSSAASTVGGRKLTRWKKTYLAAGLFSDYFKCLEPPAALSKRQQKKSLETTPTFATPVETEKVQMTLLPPPPYCEKYFRRTEVDFDLPYDIWWAYKNSKLPARVTVPSWNYRKIRTNIYAESVRPNMAGFDHPTCNCKPDVGCGDNCLNRLVYTECSPSCCPTREKCRNQKIYRHEVAPGVERFMTENKGWGVRTKLPIRKGTYILEYVGEVVTEREFKDRMGTIYLNDTHHYCLHLDGGLVIDGHRMGSDGRFVNHSCQPNCEMQKWSVNGLSRMALFAARNINEDEELTYDYNFSLFNPAEGQPCRCNTPQCRGVIGGKSQRIKPLPIIELKPLEAPTKQEARSGRPRKRKAKKISAIVQSKDVVVARVQQLSEKDKKYIKQRSVFLLRNFEKIRKYKRKLGLSPTPPPNSEIKSPTPAPSPVPPICTSPPAAISNRRSSTPASLAAQISALRSPRNMKTRGLALANSDPELEKMAKMAVILRDICVALESLNDPKDPKTLLTAAVLLTPSSVSTGSGNRKRKLAKTAIQKNDTLCFQTIKTNIEKGFYKQLNEFDADMQLVFEQAFKLHSEDASKLDALNILTRTYSEKKRQAFKQLLEVASESACKAFLGEANLLEEHPTGAATSIESTKTVTLTKATTSTPYTSSDVFEAEVTPNEDIIRCICGLYKDEGLMIQCARCMVWQHTECTKADINADSYLCERCEPRQVDREIPLEDFTDDGHRYYLSLLRGELHVRQGDTVYVLRDIPVKDAAGKVIPTKKHTYDTIGDIDYSECDIFRVERLWKNAEGKRFIFGHHFLRPHETFHEPSRRFYPNEVVRVPLYEVVPIELVIGRCWVLDRTTFCKGRPSECSDEAHCYICELRVDKSARFFSKAKINYPACTKYYAFRKFVNKLKIAKTYAPHEVVPAMLKAKKQKTELELEPSGSTATEPTTSTIATTAARNETNKTPIILKKRQSSNSPAAVQVMTPVAPTLQTIKAKRSHLEVVLKAMKLKIQKNTQLVNEPPLDLSYLMSGRGARQRKTHVSASVSSANVPA